MKPAELTRHKLSMRKKTVRNKSAPNQVFGRTFGNLKNQKKNWNWQWITIHAFVVAYAKASVDKITRLQYNILNKTAGR